MSNPFKPSLIAFLVTLACGLTSQPAFGQERNQARKFDEYSKCKQGVPGCISMEGEWARIDALAAELRADLSLQAYIIGYKARLALPGSSLRHINYVRDLVRSRVVDDSRVKVIDGGYRENLTIELWWVPDPAVAPTPSGVVKVEAAAGESAYKFDEFQPPTKKESQARPFPEDESVYYSPPVLMDGFAALLEREPRLRGFIIAHDGQHDRSGTANRFAERYRHYVYHSSSIGNNPNVDTNKPSRVVTLKRGRRKDRTIELWVVPPGASPPEPGPKLQTPRGNR